MYTFFIMQDNALENEEITQAGQLELLYEIYQLYILYNKWEAEFGTHNTEKNVEGLLSDRMNVKLAEIYNQVNKLY